MKNVEYLHKSFVNVQELIRFTDQKIAAVLVVCGIEIPVFVAIFQELEFSLNSSLVGYFTFFLGVITAGLVTLIFYMSLLKVLRPGLAESYTAGEKSLFYFVHIANSDRNAISSRIKEYKEEDQILELSHQLYEISKILKRKINYSRKIIMLLFLSFVSIGLFILLSTRL